MFSCPCNDNYNKVLTQCFSTMFQVTSFLVLSTVVLTWAIVLLVWGLVDIIDMISTGPSYGIYGGDNYVYTTMTYYNDYDYDYYNKAQTYFDRWHYLMTSEYGVLSWLPRWAYDYDYEHYHHFRDDAASHTTLASSLRQYNQTCLLNNHNSPMFVNDLFDSICFALCLAREII